LQIGKEHSFCVGFLMAEVIVAVSFDTSFACLLAVLSNATEMPKTGFLRE
jgi:hypothetical protein